MLQMSGKRNPTISPDTQSGWSGLRGSVCGRLGARGALKRALLAAMYCLMAACTCAVAHAQLYPGVGCVATAESRSVAVAADGSYILPNIPVNTVVPTSYRVRVVCPQADGSLLGATSDYLQLVPNATQNLPVMQLGPVTPQSSSLIVQAISGVLSSVGSSIQLEVQSVLPDSDATPPAPGASPDDDGDEAGGGAFDVTPSAKGTTYSTSNAAVATVSTEGLVTATGPGKVIITARNDGLAATVMLSSFAQIDSDGDGMPDAWEIANGLNPYDPTDAAQDPDGDGLTNLQEYQLGTNPHVADTDGDGLTDGQEVALGTNPLVADTDGDGLSDGQEVALGTNPLVADTDGDGIPDGVEIKIGTNPVVFDVTTTVVGHVSNPDGTPFYNASIVVRTYFTGVTDRTGTFTLLHVPVALGNITVSARAVVGTQVLSGSSNAFAPNGNGVTDIGTIVLGQSTGQVSGTVSTPDNKPDVGAQVTVVGGADVRTAITDGSGIYIVSGLQPGGISVAVLDPATSLRGLASGVLTPAGPLTLNIKVAAYGTVSGTVRNVSGVAVGAGITVVISGTLNSSTVTDALGHYTFPFVPLGGVTLNAADGNGNQGRAATTVTATSQSLNVDVQYLGRGTVTGTIMDQGGNAIPGATVNLSNVGQLTQYLTTTTDALGHYTFSSVFVGTVNLSAYSSVSKTGNTASGAVTTDGQTITVNIGLQSTGTISGTVFHSDGKTALSGAQITLPGTALTATANASGQYSVTNVPLGNYTVLAADPASADRGSSTGALATTGQTLTLNITTIGVGTLNVTVTDGASVPAAGVVVTISTNGVNNFYTTQQSVTAADGTVTFNQQLAGSIQVSAINTTTNLSGSNTATLAPGGTAAVTVKLQSSGVIQGTVHRLDGVTPVPGVTVQADYGGPVLTNASGFYTLPIIPIGAHQVLVTDSVHNFLANNTSITVSTQGQVVTANFVIIGRGTVTGHITKPDGTPAGGVSVAVTSKAPNDGNALATQSGIDGLYTIPNMPVGDYSVVAQQHTVTTNSYGTAIGTIHSDGGTTTTDIQLSTALVPSTQNFTDANGMSYPVRENGALVTGQYSVFSGDSAANQGGSLLNIVQGGVSTQFTGEEYSPINLNGQQISIEQDGLDGLNVTRRVYVPGDGYFARYVELLNNPTASDITADINIVTNYRNVQSIVQLATFQQLTVDPPHILQTSSGDNILNIADPISPDHWLTLGGPVDDDPFLTFRGNRGAYTPIPPIADVFDGPGAGLKPTSAGYSSDPSGTFSKFSYTYANVKIPAGATIGILHFVSQENHFKGANTAAARLEQLPPEALVGLTPADIGSIANFVVPGVSAVPPLGSLTNQVTGFVYAQDGTTPVSGAGVAYQSSDALFGRLYTTQAGPDGSFNFQGYFQGFAIPADNFTLSATHPITQIVSPTFSGSFAPGSTSTAQDVSFTNSGTISGTVSRGPTVLNTAGVVQIVGGSFASPITLPINLDGTYSLTGVPVGGYTITAFVTNTLLKGTTTTTVATGQKVTADITIGDSGNLQGTVTRADNSLAVNDYVNLRIVGQNPLQALIDTSGHYLFVDVPIGSYTIDCFDQTSNSAASAPVTVTASATTTQNLVLQSSGIVTGAVTANDGSSVANLTITLTSTTTSGTQTLNTSTSANGQFSFNLVKPGTILVSTSTPAGLHGTASGSLPLAGQTTTLNIRLIAAGTLTGTVFQGDGVTPAAGIQVTLSPAPLSGSAITTTDANGVYNYALVAFGGFNVYAANLANGDQGQANGQIQTNGQLRTINIRLNGFGNLTVKVVDTSSSPVANAAVSVQNGSIGTRYTGTADATGTALFNNIYAGPFSVSGRDPVTGLNATSSGTLVAGSSQTITLTLQAVATIKGTVYAPDGVTPVAGAAVQANAPYGPSVTTGADGSYTLFPLSVGGYYALSARDATGLTRATLPGIVLQGSGSITTENLTFLGVGSVSGLVTNIDGSPLENYYLTVISQNSTIGTTLQVKTGGDGTYTVPELPIGKFSVAVAGLPSNLIGYGSGTIASNGSAVTLNIQVISSGISLPVTLTDADGYNYQIASDGSFAASGVVGGLSPFYSAQPLSLNIAGTTSYFAQGNIPTTALQSLGGQQIEISQQTPSGLNVTRKIYVPTDGYFSRRIESLQNPTSSPITVTVQIGGSERYSKYSPQVIATSKGNKTVDKTILWAVDDDDTGSQPYPQTQPALANVFAGPGAPTGMSTVATSFYTPPFQPFQNFIYYTTEFWSYVYSPITIQPNSTANILFFTAQEASSATAITAAQRLDQLPAEALAGMSADDLASVVNFVVPAVQSLPALTPPPTNTMSGHVYAGDGTTPIPLAQVYVQSTDLEYGFGTTAAADATGVYNLPAVVAQSYAAQAIDPATNVTSTGVVGTYAANSTSQTQDIIFSNTGILQGLIQATGAGMFVGGTGYLDLPCSNGVLYCNRESATFGPAGHFTILTALAGNDGIAANVVTAQGGNISLPPSGNWYPITVPAQQTTQFTLTLPATGNIQGTLSNADGSPAAGIKITVSPYSNGTYVTANTGAGGVFAFSSIVTDTYLVSATDPITGGTVSKTVIVSQDATTTVNLVFIGKSDLVVTVHYANGNIGANSQLAIATSTNANYSYASSLTDANGQYTFPNVPTGPFTIRAFYPGQSFYSTTAGILASNGVTQPITVMLTPVGTISGTLTYANGSPAPSEYVLAQDSLSIFGTYALTDSAGTYGIFPVPADRAITVRSSDQNNPNNGLIQVTASNRQIPADGATLTVNLRYPGMANVKVTVLQSDGTPYNTGSVSLKSNDGLQHYAQPITANGTATFNNVVEADFVAIAGVNNYYGYNTGSKVFTVKPTDDGTTVQVTIQTSATGKIQGTVFASDGTTVITTNYYLKLVDVDTGTTNYADTSGPGYVFNNVQLGASGFALTPQFGNTLYPALTAYGNITTPNQVVTQNFTLPISCISGTVYLNDGATIVPNAQVVGSETVSGAGNYFNAYADINGKYQLCGAVTGAVSLTAYDSNGVKGTATVNLTSDTQIVTGEGISLGPVGTVMGTVYDANHLVVPNLDVYVNSTGNNGGFQADATTDANGFFQATDIPTGDISLYVTLPDNTHPGGNGTLINNGDTITVNIGAPPPIVTGTIFGTVYDSNQDPNPGATVTVTASDAAMTVLTATTDGNGIYTVTGVPFGDVSVSATLSDNTTAGPVTGNLPDGTTPVEVDLGLSNPGDVSGVVYDKNGTPFANVSIGLSSSGDTSVGYGEATGSDGSFDFSGIAPGTITITVTDNSNNVIGTATALLPYGGDVVVNVQTTTLSAVLKIPALGRLKRLPSLALGTPARRLLPATATKIPEMSGDVAVLLQQPLMPRPPLAQGAQP